MFRSFQAGLCAAGDFERLVTEATELLSHPAKLSAAQEEAARFVNEWHDNEANVKAFLGGLSR
jgi:hypothetical protein